MSEAVDIFEARRQRDAAVVADYTSGEPVEQIAARFGLHPTSISKIARRHRAPQRWHSRPKQWAHRPPRRHVSRSSNGVER